MRKSFLQTLIRFLFPIHCNGCGTYGVSICPKCTQTLRLARPLPDDRDFAVFDYGDKLVRQAIRKFKYHHDANGAEVLTTAAISHIQSFLGDTLQNTTTQTITIVPVPQHRLKTYARGYNQSLLIAQWISKGISGTVIQELLYKTVPSTPQARTKNKSARKQNVAHTMRTTISLNSKNIYLLVDDVTTTGATLNEARRALQQGGGKKILSVSIAHGYIST